MNGTSLLAKTGSNRFRKIRDFERIVPAHERVPHGTRSPSSADDLSKLRRRQSFELNHKAIVPQEPTADGTPVRLLIPPQETCYPRPLSLFPP